MVEACSVWCISIYSCSEEMQAVIFWFRMKWIESQAIDCFLLYLYV